MHLKCKSGIAATVQWAVAAVAYTQNTPAGSIGVYVLQFEIWASHALGIFVVTLYILVSCTHIQY